MEKLPLNTKEYLNRVAANVAEQLEDAKDKGLIKPGGVFNIATKPFFKNWGHITNERVEFTFILPTPDKKRDIRVSGEFFGKGAENRSASVLIFPDDKEMNHYIAFSKGGGGEVILGNIYIDVEIYQETDKETGEIFPVIVLDIYTNGQHSYTFEFN